MNVETIGIFLAGLVIGGIVGFALALLTRSGRDQGARLDSVAKVSAAEAAARLEEERREELEQELERVRAELPRLDREAAVASERGEQAAALVGELKEFREQSRRELTDSFKALAAEALAGSNKQFLNLAEQRLSTSEERARADLDERKKAVENLLDPLRKTLESLDLKTQEIEKARVEAYSRIDQQVQALAEATGRLQEKTTSLTTALKSSQVRGRWGELALRGSPACCCASADHRGSRR